MSESKRDQELRAKLSSLAEPAAETIRYERGYVALTRSVRQGVLPSLVLIPAAYFIFSLALRSVGHEFAIPMGWVFVAALLYPAFLLFAYWRRARQQAINDRSALAMIDDKLELKDRLSIAHEFLDADEKSPFMLAAIEDAETRVDQAKEARFDTEPRSFELTKKDALWPALAVIFLVVGGLISVQPPFFKPRPQAPETAEVVAENDVQPERPTRKKTQKKPEAKKENPSDERREGNKKDLGSEEIPEDKKESKGKVGLGKSAQAQSVGGQSSGEGAASSQAQPTQGGSKKKPKKQAKKKKPSSEKKNKKGEAPQDDKKSVASAGRGRGKGASRSPTASDWSSKDQIVTDEDEEFDEDEDVDDDEEESDARGGVQPNLRSRKPPVNRDLNIGFGGGKPPPFANGRGGPGLPKKQRGVAQLVLGVPFPDHITGQPNPGMTKVTQERIEPQANQSKKIGAEDRKPRSTPMGRLNHKVLTPWMQDLVREFYETMTSQTP